MTTPRRRRTVAPRTAIRRAWDELEARGLKPTAARICANGDVILLTDSPSTPPVSGTPEALDAEVEALING